MLKNMFNKIFFIVIIVVSLFFFSFEIYCEELKDCYVNNVVELQTVSLYEKDSIKIIYDAVNFNVYLFCGQYFGFLGNFKNTFNVEPEVDIICYDPDFVCISISNIFFDMGKRFSDVSVYTLNLKENKLNEVAYVESVGVHDVDVDDLSPEGNYTVRIEFKSFVVIEEYVRSVADNRKIILNVKRIPFVNRGIWFFRLL